MSVRVLLADEHAIGVMDTRALLDAEDGTEVVDGAADGGEALVGSARLLRAVAAMDINMSRPQPH